MMNDFNWTTLFFDEKIPLESLFARLDERPSIYSFCVSLKRINSNNATKWINSLESVCNLPHGETLGIKVGNYESIRLKYLVNSNFSYLTEKNLLGVLDKDPEFLAKLNSLSNIVQTMIPPLYVGETGNLLRRVKEHLSGDSESLFSRFKSEGIGREDVFLKYFYIESLGLNDLFSEEVEACEADDESLALQAYSRRLPDRKALQPSVELNFIEEYITRLVKPRFVRKVGENKRD